MHDAFLDRNSVMYESPGNWMPDKPTTNLDDIRLNGRQAAARYSVPSQIGMRRAD